MHAINAPFRYTNDYYGTNLCFMPKNFPYILQNTELIKNIEKLTFWAGDNSKLYFVKQELLAQINTLDISINGKGFFTINRQFLSGVSLNLTLLLYSGTGIYFYDILFFFQMVATCCTYIIIFIQFYLSNNV